VIKESLRLNPPVTFIQRVTDEPMTLEGYDIPVGTTVNVVIVNVLTNPTLWEDPLVSSIMYLLPPAMVYNTLLAH
jgi:cytochrome P450